MKTRIQFWGITLALSLCAILAVGQAQAFCIYNKMKYDSVFVEKYSYKTADRYKSCAKVYKGTFEHFRTGRCYSCPKGYKRTVFKISGGKYKGARACAKGGVAGVKAEKYAKAKYHGAIPRNNSFKAKIQPGKRACCHWKTGGCNQTMKQTGLLEFSTNLVAGCTIPGKGPGSGPTTPAINCPPLKFKIQAGGSAHIYGRKRGSTGGSFTAIQFDSRGRESGRVSISDRGPVTEVPPPGKTGR